MTFKLHDRWFVWGQDRTNPNVLAHLYELDVDDYIPMCSRGWNRSNGFGYSILRGERNISKGKCKICQWRADMNLPARQPRERKTKYL